jgi:poly-gamma-glutamate capsule biosynthesis protein CapA/YwtB (metallophosphatase superfamily)
MKRILLFAYVLLAALLLGCSGAPSEEVLPESTAAPVSTTPFPVSAEPAEALNSGTPGVFEPQPARVTLLAVGDLLCLGGQLRAAKVGNSYDFESCFGEVRNTISSADLAIANLETLIAKGYPFTAMKSGEPNPSPDQTPGSDDPGDIQDPGSPGIESPSQGSGIFGSAFYGSPVFSGLISSKTDAIRFLRSGNPRINGPEAFLAAVRGAGFDLLTASNNHMYDYKADGLIKTLSLLDRYGFSHTGSYALPEDRKPLVVNVKGISVSVLAYTDVLNNKPGKDNAYMVNRYDETAITEDIKAARGAGADFVIVSMHWGKEHTHKPTKRQRQMAAFIAGAGADLILGAHPHCMQPAELIETDKGNVPVFYSIGNFLSSMPEWIHKDGVMVTIVLEKEPEKGSVSIAELRYIPTLCIKTESGNYTVMPADEASAVVSQYSSKLRQARERIIKVLGDTVCKPE